MINVGWGMLPGVMRGLSLFAKASLATKQAQIMTSKSEAKKSEKPNAVAAELKGVDTKKPDAKVVIKPAENPVTMQLNLLELNRVLLNQNDTPHVKLKFSELLKFGEFLIERRSSDIITYESLIADAKTTDAEAIKKKYDGWAPFNDLYAIDPDFLKLVRESIVVAAQNLAVETDDTKNDPGLLLMRHMKTAIEAALIVYNQLIGLPKNHVETEPTSEIIKNFVDNIIMPIHKNLFDHNLELSRARRACANLEILGF